MHKYLNSQIFMPIMANRLTILKLISNETRLKILECLKSGEKCACEIVPFTKKSQPNVSLHLKKMEAAGILMSRKEGTMVKYSIKDHRVLKALDILK